jgi:hypothetical protein
MVGVTSPSIGNITNASAWNPDVQLHGISKALSKVGAISVFQSVKIVLQDISISGIYASVDSNGRTFDITGFGSVEVGDLNGSNRAANGGGGFININNIIFKNLEGTGIHNGGHIVIGNNCSGSVINSSSATGFAGKITIGDNCFIGDIFATGENNGEDVTIGKNTICGEISCFGAYDSANGGAGKVRISSNSHVGNINSTGRDAGLISIGQDSSCGVIFGIYTNSAGAITLGDNASCGTISGQCLITGEGRRLVFGNNVFCSGNIDLTCQYVGAQKFISFGEGCICGDITGNAFNPTAGITYNLRLSDGCRIGDIYMTGTHAGGQSLIELVGSEVGKITLGPIDGPSAKIKASNCRISGTLDYAFDNSFFMNCIFAPPSGGGTHAIRHLSGIPKLVDCIFQTTPLSPISGSGSVRMYNCFGNNATGAGITSLGNQLTVDANLSGL